MSWLRCAAFRAITIAASLIAIFPPKACFGGSFTAFGPQNYTRGTGSPVTETGTFTVLNPATQYTLKAFNGGLQNDQTELVSSTVVTVNGVQVLGGNNFNQNVQEVDVPVVLQGSNTISVQVRGKPGGTLAIEIVGVDNDPPLITANVSPAPNATGWNNTNVTVTFNCSDQTSGVANCPAPQTVATEGANQVISGTATDKAGNIASASVMVNLDKTPPNITATASPGPNAAGWNNTPVTVTFFCSDPTSGIGNCPQAQTVSSDGKNQVISGTATDTAGNTASASVAVSIDQTPPAITAVVSPTPNVAGWNNTDPTVTFSCTDSASGIATCPPPQTITDEGVNQIINGTAFDNADNSANTSVTINLDKTPPVVAIASPVNSSTISLSTASIGLNGSESDDLSGVSQVTCNGSPAAVSGSNFTCSVLLTQGPNSISVQATDIAGNSSSSPLSLTYLPAPQLALTAPANLSITNLTPTTVSGTISDPAATITVNGIPAPQSGGSFTISVPLVEGLNVLTAVATNASGVASTATAQVTLDTTPPRITIDSPADGSTTTSDSVVVSGLANDVVVGTVNAQDVQVTVNGITAQVGNRTYAALAVPLTLGKNTVQAVAHDRAGNGTTTNITVNRVLATQPPQPAIGNAVITQSLAIISGNNQAGTIGTQLSAPLMVALTDSSNHPVVNQPVVFKVAGNNGTVGAAGANSTALAVNTDAAGHAQASWILGQRAGAGNNTVQVSSPLAVGQVTFIATGSNAAAASIVVDSGNEQVGVLGQPLPFPFVADVVDSGHNRVPNVPVTFTVKQGDGTLSGSSTQTVNTDSNGRAIVLLTLGTQIGNANNLVEATFPNNPGFPAAFAASARAPGDPAATTVSGVVLDNSNNPIPGVTIRLFQTNQGNTNNLPVQVGTPVQTDAKGTFLIQPAPVGFFKLMADGSTATSSQSYPPLEYDIVTIAGNDNTVGMPIYLPALDQVNRLCVDETHGGTLTLPQVPGFALTVLPGSATFPGGSRQGCVTVTPVNGDKVPMSPGFGQQPRFIVTIQPVGTKFDPPAPMTLPNVDGLKPNAVTEMYSYDHDLGMFVAIGTGTVSADGSVIASNPGVGVLKAGWHCGGDPNSSGSSASLGVSIAPTKVTKGKDDQFTLTASGAPSQDGTYTWELLALQQGDDVSAAQLVASPSCDDQPTCTASLMGIKGGSLTLRVHFKCKTTSKEVTADARITVVTVEFQTDGGATLPSPLRIGITVGSHNRTQHLQAIIKPDAEAANVTLTASSALSLSNVARTGNTIKFDLVGVTRSTTRGDASIIATHTSGVTVKQAVSVVVPAQVATPHDTNGGGLVSQNVALDATTSPALGDPIPPGTVALVTIYDRFLNITVKDQFGDLIGDLYQGASITEGGIPINQSLSAASTYSDPVGPVFAKSPDIAVTVVPRGSADATAWSSQPLVPMQFRSTTQNIPVEVDRFSLHPAIENRQVTATQPNTVTITWP